MGNANAPPSNANAPARASATWMVCIGLSLGVAVSNGFARFAYGLILPSMRSDLDWTYAQAGWINTANALGYLAGAVIALMLVRRRSPAMLFAVGIVGTALSLAATGLTQDFWLLTLWRVTAGVFGAPTFIAGGAFAAGLFPDARRTALAIAVYFGGGGLGMIASGAVLPSLLDRLGPEAWPSAWLDLGATSVVACIPALWAVSRLSIGTSLASASAPTAAIAPARLPVPAMLSALVGYSMFATGYIVTITFLVAFMRDLGADPALVSSVWIVMGAAIVISPFAWRWILARFENGIPLAAATLVTALGTGVPIVWTDATGLVVGAALFGIAVFIGPAAVTTFSRRNLPSADQASGIALFTVVFAVGQTIGPIAAGAIGDAYASIAYGLGGAVAILVVGAAIASLQTSLKERPR